MGYYTDYEIEVIDLDSVDTMEKIASELNYFPGYEFTLSGFSLYLECSKWYSWNSDMIELSKRFKNILFKITGAGEEKGDMWVAYALNGNIKSARAVITYPKIDMSEFYYIEEQTCKILK